MSKQDIHLEILKIAAKELKPLKEEVVFIGGSTISLFITEPQAVSIRETLDVDCVVEVSHRANYEEIAKKLRKIGFNEDAESKVICRFKKGEYLFSHDIEDLASGEEKITPYLRAEFKKLLETPRFVASLDSHISDRTNLVGRKARVLRMKAFIGQ